VIPVVGGQLDGLLVPSRRLELVVVVGRDAGKTERID